jgi:hypothetical protein
LTQIPRLSLNLTGIVALGKPTGVTIQRIKVTDAILLPLGTVSVTGTLVVPKWDGESRPVHGTLTISNGEGSITISLKGTENGENSALFTYKILHGTKADKGATGTGQVLYALAPIPPLPSGGLLLDFGNVLP